MARRRSCRLPTSGTPYRRGRRHPIADATREPRAISRDIAHRVSTREQAFEVTLCDRRYKDRKSACRASPTDRRSLSHAAWRSLVSIRAG